MAAIWQEHRCLNSPGICLLSTWRVHVVKVLDPLLFCFGPSTTASGCSGQESFAVDNTSTAMLLLQSQKSRQVAAFSVPLDFFRHRGLQLCACLCCTSLWRADGALATHQCEASLASTICGRGGKTLRSGHDRILLQLPCCRVLIVHCMNVMALE